MIRKSQQLKSAIREGIIELLKTKAERIYLPGNFDGFFVQLQDYPKLPAEPILFSEYEINPEDYGCDQDHFFFVVERLM